MAGADTLTGAGPSARPGELSTRTLGGFLLREQVGAGGFGDVYLAEQIGLKREAIVKVLRPDDMNETRVHRFLREAQLASRLDHPYAAHIYAFGTESDGVFWIAMERVRGASLRAVLEAQGPMPLERFVPLLERICEVVQTAHEQGIIHRDLKPDNVMVISRAGRLLPKLLDFGIARAVGGDEPAPEALASQVTPPEELDRTGGITTQRGAVLGSPSYMAPELWVDPHGAGAAADQYALGALAYEALTGRLAFTGKTVLEVARAHAKGKVKPLGDGFPKELELVIMRALSKAHGNRFGNVLELAQAFRDASGIGAATVDLPQLDDELRTQFLSRAPQPVADAVAAYDASRNPHQAREALRGLVRTAGWYVGVLALACRTRVGSGGAADSEHAQRLLRDLRRQGLAPAGWVALARQLTLPFARLPDTYPLPELVLLLHPPTGTDAFTPVLEGSLSESLADSSDEAASQSIARELPVVTQLLRALTFLLDYELVVPGDGRAESWMGVRSRTKRVVTLRRSLPDGRPVVVDATGSPLLAVWPLVQVHVAVPGHSDQMFMLSGPGRAGAKLVSTPHGFEHRDDDLWDWFRQQLFADDDAASASPVAESPYRGLSAYRQGDAQLFFGRERETEALINRLKMEAFVAIVGPSGVGKSSFVHAGVAPSLAGWRVVTTRPGRTPLAQLAGQLAHAGIDAGELHTAGAADRLRRRATEVGGLLIVVDQFEELFTLGSAADERDRFVRLLLAISSTVDEPMRVVITLRDDFLIRAQQLPGFDHALARGLQLLGPLGPEALERIVVEPARRAGFELEDPTLPARMVEETLGTPAAVALISFTASRLWELRDRHFHQLPRKAYDAIGGVAGALAQHADETVDAMPAAERALVRKAFRHLVTFEGTRAVLGRDELRELLGGGDDAERLIERLVEARLVTSSEGETGANVVEIVHEALVVAWPRLVEWRREDVEGSRFHEQLRAAAKQWDDRRRPRGLLWRGDALAEYQLWRKRHPDNLTPLETAFGAASIADATRGRRIRRGLIAIAAAATAVFVLVLWRANRAEQRLLRDSTFDQGRLMMLQGDKLKALAPFAKAYRMGETGPAIRLLVEEALRTTRARLFSLEGHTSKLWNVLYSPDGKTIATAGADGTVRLWDASNGAPLAVFHHAGPAIAMEFSPDGTVLASGGRDEKVRLWSVAERREVRSFDIGRHEEPQIHQLSFSPDGKRLLVGGANGILKVWTVATGELVGDVQGPEGESAASYCTRGDCLITWDASGRIVWRDAQTLVERSHVDAGPNVVDVEADPAGDWVVLTTEAGELVVTRSDGTVVSKRTAHDQAIGDVSVSPDGKVIATASADNTVRLWDPGGKSLAILTGHRGQVMSVKFSPNSDLVATSSADGAARLWTVPAGNLVAELSGHTNFVVYSAFNPDGTRLATVSWDHRAIVWDVAAARQFLPVETAKLDFAAAPEIEFDKGGDRFALVAPDGSLAILNAATQQVMCRAHAEHPIAHIAWSRDGFAIATVGGDDHVVRIWNARSCALEHQLTQPGIVESLAFGPAGTLVTGAEDRSVRLWDVSTEHERATYREYPGPVSKVGFDANDARIFAFTFDKAAAIVLQSVALPEQKRVLNAGKQPLSGIEFDPARHRIIASGLDQYLWLWDDRTGDPITRLEATGPLFAVRSSSDREVIVGVGGGSPVVWDATTLSRIGILEGHANLVVDGGFLDDRLFLTASRDGTARVWDIETLHALMILDNVQAAIISDDRRSVVLCDTHGTREWLPQLPEVDLELLDQFVKSGVTSSADHESP